MFIARSGIARAYAFTATTDAGSYASEAAALKHKRLDNRPLQSLLVLNFEGNTHSVRLWFKAPVGLAAYNEHFDVAPSAEASEFLVEASDLWVAGIGGDVAMNVLFGERMT